MCLSCLTSHYNLYFAQKVPSKKKATYHGGEKRIDMPSTLAHAAVVTEGASLGSKDLIPLCLLQRIMGTGPVVKYTDNVAGSKVRNLNAVQQNNKREVTICTW